MFSPEAQQPWVALHRVDMPNPVGEGDRHIGAGSGTDNQHLPRWLGDPPIGLAVERFLLQPSRCRGQSLVWDPVDIDLPFGPVVAVGLRKGGDTVVGGPEDSGRID